MIRQLVALVLFISGTTLSSAQAKEKVMILSWGDVIWQHKGQGIEQLDTPEKVRAAARVWKAQGVNSVLFRVDDFRIILHHRLYLAPDNDYIQMWAATTKKAWQDGLLTTAVEAIKKEGMRVEMWITVFDEGTPRELRYSWQSNFTREHPEYLSCDRSLTASGRKYHYGVMEYAYPEVRRYMIEMIGSFSDHFAFDGVFLSVRSHSAPAEHADQFGFNEPVAKEFERRYGRNILMQDFDLEKWRALRGEYFTTFLQEVKTHLKSRGQTLAIGVAQGEYIGPPFGNMRLEWRRWVSEKIVDELVVGHLTNERARHPNLTQRAAGYIQNQEDGLGLPPIEQAVREDYGPLCRKHGVKLYVEPRNFYRVYDHPALGSGRQPPETLERLTRELQASPELDGIVYAYRDIMAAVH